MAVVPTRQYLRYFADLLAYPDSSLPVAARACLAAVAAQNPDAGKLLHAFASYVEQTPLPRLEEAYTSVFDLNPKCFPYVGYHLFGESYKRSLFLVGLKEHYRGNRLTYDGELPDHLAIILRFLAETEDTSIVQELIEAAVLPALERMTGRAPSAGYVEPAEVVPEPEGKHRNAPYLSVLEALQLVLQGILVRSDQP